MNAKESAQHIIDQLPEQASWDDIMYELYVKQKIDVGIEAAEDGKTVSHKDIKSRILSRSQRNNA